MPQTSPPNSQDHCLKLSQKLEQWQSSFNELRGIVDIGWREGITKERKKEYETKKKEVQEREQEYRKLKDSMFIEVPGLKEKVFRSDYDFLEEIEKRSKEKLFGTDRIKFQNRRLTYLDVGSLNIDSLPNLPASLEVLGCSNTQISSLELPASLKRLDCSNTQISSLKLPQSLEALYCSNTQISSLELPQSLEWLYCFNSQLTSISEFPSTLRRADLRDNQFSEKEKERIRQDAEAKNVELTI